MIPDQRRAPYVHTRARWQPTGSLLAAVVYGCPACGLGLANQSGAE